MPGVLNLDVFGDFAGRYTIMVNTDAITCTRSYITKQTLRQLNNHFYVLVLSHL